MAQVYLNGEFLPLEDAKVSVLDRGFLFGDGVYEVIPVFSGRPLQQQAHLDRLYRSLQAIELTVQQTCEDWQALFSKLLTLNKAQGDNLSIYLQVTRGVDGKRAHGYSDKIVPTVFAMVMPFQPNIQCANDELHDKPTGRAITMEDRRWKRCDIKSTSLLGALLPYQKAHRAGITESILIDQKGNVTEGASSNVFAVIDGCIVTPPLSDRILGGVTRALVLELVARDRRMSCEERVLTADELQWADEIWITSSSREILPIVELDGVVVGRGEPGEVWQYVAGLYQAYRDAAPERYDDRRTQSTKN